MDPNRPHHLQKLAMTEALLAAVDRLEQLDAELEKEIRNSFLVLWIAFLFNVVGAVWAIVAGQWVGLIHVVLGVIIWHKAAETKQEGDLFRARSQKLCGEMRKQLEELAE